MNGYIPSIREEEERHQALALNLLILLGYNNAVTIDQAMSIREVLAVATDPEQTDGTVYSREEISRAIDSLLRDELIRQVKANFDGSSLVEYATGLHGDHLLYITPGGVLHVKRLTERAERDEAARRRDQ